MKIAVAQTRPIKGDIQANIYQHTSLINLALAEGTQTIIFPELSITGYEPELARQLATTPDDPRFNTFQEISNTGNITIGIGVPIQYNTGICIGMVLFQPNQPRQTYLKKYLHPDEEAFFLGGQNTPGFIDENNKLALAICYELAVPEHAAHAYQNGAKIYAASVAKSVDGVEKAAKRLASIGQAYGLFVLMANCIGPSGGMDCGGKTAVWNKQGELLLQLDDGHEGIIVFDTLTQEAIARTRSLSYYEDKTS